MTREQQRLADYLTQIVEAIERVGRYTKGLDDAAFRDNPLVQDAVIRNIEKRYPDFAAAHPDLPLAFAYQMRNAVAHGYFKVDLGIVWKTIQNDLPGLHAQIQEVQANLHDRGDDGMGP